MTKMEINLKDLNIYIVAKKFLDKNYGQLLAKNECFEINGASPSTFWFKVVTKKGLISNISNIEERNKILGKHFLETTSGYFNFDENYINKFRKYKIQKETYMHCIINYIVYNILMANAKNYKSIKEEYLHTANLHTANSRLRILTTIIDDKMKAKWKKLGMIVTSNKRYTYISLENNAKEIYTYLRLSGEINVLTE